MHIFPVHISSLISHVATATLFLREIICPRKSDANLKQVIIFILLRGGENAAGPILPGHYRSNRIALRKNEKQLTLLQCIVTGVVIH